MKTKFALTLIFSALIFSAFAQVPTRWRGPAGNGNYAETGLMKSWPASGPQILWSYDKLGEGFSSPSFANQMIYISGMEGSTGYVYALTQEGKLIWKKAYGPEFTESYPGSRSTPMIAGDLLYIYSAFGVLTCMSANSGDIKWTKDTFKEFGGEQIQWGVTESPVIDGDRIYITPGGKQHNVVALNRMNGNLIWSSKGLGEKSAYCTPLVVKLPSRTLLVTHTESHVIGLDAADGKLLWSHNQPNRWSVHSNTPIYHDGAIFYFSGYGQGGGLLKLSADGSSVNQQWFSKKMDNRIGGAVLVDGHIYGSGDNNRFWMCLDWNTGEVKYEAKGLANGAVIYADGMLYGYTDRGELFLAEANPREWKLVSQAKVELGTAQHWAHPVIDNGRLFVRHGNTLIAYKIKP
ncbi:MAG: PQQ-binding-like beta-propeller repeat protein [Bacteroidota bacterium]